MKHHPAILSSLAAVILLSCPSMEAQDDGSLTVSVQEADSITTAAPLPPVFHHAFFRPSYLLPAFPYSNYTTLNPIAASVLKSMNHNLGFYRQHPLEEVMSKEWAMAIKISLFVAGFFLTPQFSVPQGYVQLGTTQFQAVKTPGWAPDAYSGMYSPEIIPQCIRTEYDPSSGTYKQVMVDWKTVEGYQYNLNPGAGIDVKPVPTMHFNAVERQVFGR